MHYCTNGRMSQESHRRLWVDNPNSRPTNLCKLVIDWFIYYYLAVPYEKTHCRVCQSHSSLPVTYHEILETTYVKVCRLKKYRRYETESEDNFQIFSNKPLVSIEVLWTLNIISGLIYSKQIQFQCNGKREHNFPHTTNHFFLKGRIR